jgi:SAM-dependent MidA family methyltransferase
METMTQLSDIIIKKIGQEGPISFHDFMSMALYHPSLGYYSSSKNRIGPDGDYYTSPCVSAAFGALIGKQIEEMWYVCGEHPFVIVEYGGGSGTLCNDILNSISNNKKMYAALQYFIIEENNRGNESRIAHENVVWRNTAEDIAITNGCILSNELLDNFPVHQVVMEEELMEVFVDYDNGFTEMLKPASDDLKNYLKQLNVCLPAGFCTEINLQALNWLEEITRILKRGFVITIDYGCHSKELYHDRRKKGTILCYHKHRINDSPYLNIGEQDITAHVNFSALALWGNKYGLDHSGFTDQAHFLRSLNIAAYFREMELSGKYSLDEMRNGFMVIHTLLVSMGSKLKMLIQQKGLPKTELSAFKFASSYLPVEETA